MIEIKKIGLQSTVKSHIQKCSDRDHVQQVAYSTYHNALTQVCFSCETVRTNLDKVSFGETDKEV